MAGRDCGLHWAGQAARTRLHKAAAGEGNTRGFEQTTAKAGANQFGDGGAGSGRSEIVQNRGKYHFEAWQGLLFMKIADYYN